MLVLLVLLLFSISIDSIDPLNCVSGSVFRHRLISSPFYNWACVCLLVFSFVCLYACLVTPSHLNFVFLDSLSNWFGTALLLEIRFFSL